MDLRWWATWRSWSATPTTPSPATGRTSPSAGTTDSLTRDVRACQLSCRPRSRISRRPGRRSPRSRRLCRKRKRPGSGSSWACCRSALLAHVSSLVAHVLHYPSPPREQLCNRYCSNKHTHTHFCRSASSHSWQPSPMRRPKPSCRAGLDLKPTVMSAFAKQSARRAPPESRPTTLPQQSMMQTLASAYSKARSSPLSESMRPSAMYRSLPPPPPPVRLRVRCADVHQSAALLYALSHAHDKDALPHVYTVTLRIPQVTGVCLVCS